MFDFALVAGIAITVSALLVFGLIAVLVLRAQGRYGRGRGSGNATPPPVDPGLAKPEQARDVPSED